MPFTLFATALGPCGIAWSERGVTQFQLPAATEDATRSRLAARSGDVDGAAPPWVLDAIRLVTRHLAGEPQDLRSIPIDTKGLPPFHARAYEASREVLSGQTVGYAELASRAGSPNASRAVGQAMAKNPIPVLVPCHRVLAAGGKPGGFSAYGGEDTKRKMLAMEGVTLARTEPLLGFDPEEAVRALSAADHVLGRHIESVGPLGLKVQGIQTPFQALAESIVYQQLTGRAAATIFGRVQALYGGRRAFTPDAVLATKDERLRIAGLSAAKTAALKDLAAKTKEGVVPGARALAKLSDDAIVERLTSIRGVGRWTVEMLLIFRLGRPDVLPVDDYGVRKGLMKLLGAKELPTQKEVAARGERWRPYRSAASWYLWRASEQKGGRS